MAVEVELKAHIDDVEQMKGRLSAVGSYCRSYLKSDTYWLSRRAHIPGLRVRREQGINAEGAAYKSAVVTLKAKTVSGGIEVNDEKEFTVSDAALFEELLGSLGMAKMMCKEKTGWAWNVRPSAGQGRQPPVLAELSLVRGLGWFAELEIVCDGSGQEVEESRKRLLALLAELEIPAEKIESRPYTEMLAAL